MMDTGSGATHLTNGVTLSLSQSLSQGEIFTFIELASQNKVTEVHSTSWLANYVS